MTVPIELRIYVYTITAILGLVMGSFLNCFAYRYVRQESVTKGRSHCASCGHVLCATDLIPVFSWLFLKGSCRYCGKRISPIYPAAELICAAVYLSVVVKFGITADTIRFLVLCTLLCTAALTDMAGGLIPDRIIIIGAATMAVAAFFSEKIWQTLLYTFLNGLSVSLPLLVLVLFYDKLTKKEAMGGGDIKLTFMIGLFYSWQLNLLILILACLLGILYASLKQNRGTFHFAPALALSAWVIMIFGETILEWYLRLFRVGLL